MPVEWAIALAAAVATLAILAALLPGFLKRRRRRRVMAAEPPASWDAFLERNHPLYGELPEELREKLRRLAAAFLAEKHFEASVGFAIDEDMKLIVAAEACTLLLGREKPSFFPLLDTIIVYPDAFRSNERVRLGEAWVEEEDAEKLGESWHSGSIILSWAHVKREGNMLNDGVNVVYHEFAHQLDEEDGFADGAPLFDGSAQDYKRWRETLAREYSSFARGLRHGRRSPIDEYAEESPAEFFAVATETFFEKPLQLRSWSPKLYEEFKRFYKLDPALWRELALGQSLAGSEEAGAGQFPSSIP